MDDASPMDVAQSLVAREMKDMQLVSVDTAAADAAAAADLFAHSALPYIDNQLESIHNMKEVSSDPREQRQTVCTIRRWWWLQANAAREL